MELRVAVFSFRFHSHFNFFFFFSSKGFSSTTDDDDILLPTFPLCVCVFFFLFHVLGFFILLWAAFCGFRKGDDGQFTLGLGGYHKRIRGVTGLGGPNTLRVRMKDGTGMEWMLFVG